MTSCFSCGCEAEQTSGLIQIYSKEISDASARNDGKMDYEYETKKRWFCLECALQTKGVQSDL